MSFLPPLSSLPPFLVFLAICILFWLSPRREAMMADINFYIIAVLVPTIIAVIAGVKLDPSWWDKAVWVVAVISIFACVIRSRQVPGSNKPNSDNIGPL